MSPLAVFAIVLLLNVCVFRLVRWYVGQRRVPRTSTSGAPAEPAVAPAAPVAPPAAVRAPEPVARAFPVHGLPPGRDAAVALEGVLRRLIGVTTAYVSPVTALAYLDYVAEQVTEDELVQAITRHGYRVGDAVHRFDWRHLQQG